MADRPTKLSDLIPPRTAGSLPSSRTESMLQNALDSDDIDAVKAELIHVWAHYQALEFVLVNRELNAEMIAAAMADPEFTHDVDSTTLTIGYFATVAIETAYAVAHQVNLPMQILGLSAPDALRLLFPDSLDHSDPERFSAEDLIDADTDEADD